MSTRNLFAIFMLLSLLSVSTAFAGEISKKYQDVFYPDGMPVKFSGYYGEGETEYELYDEIDIPNSNLIVVVFSEEIISSDYPDTKHSVFTSVLQSTNDIISILYLQNITSYLEQSAEDAPGYFIHMNGVLDYFDISSGMNAVHLSMTNILSGSGGISSSSDIFFLVKNDELVPVLELIGDASGGSAGTSFLAFSHTFIYLADTDSDGSMEIITQKYHYKNDKTEDIFKSELSPDLIVYKYNSAEEKYELSGQITSLPEDAVLLNPGSAPDVDALTKAGCCSGD